METNRRTDGTRETTHVSNAYRYVAETIGGVPCTINFTCNVTQCTPVMVVYSMYLLSVSLFVVNIIRTISIVVRFNNRSNKLHESAAYSYGCRRFRRASSTFLRVYGAKYRAGDSAVWHARTGVALSCPGDSEEGWKCLGRLGTPKYVSTPLSFAFPNNLSFS